MRRTTAGWRADAWVIGAAVVAAAAGCVAAGGFARRYALPANGTLAVVNTDANAVWRPCVIAVQCPSLAARTVTVYRVTGAVEYQIAQQVASAQTFVYEFAASYWSGLSNGVKVTVSPACTGRVEVICE